VVVRNEVLSNSAVDADLAGVLLLLSTLFSVNDPMVAQITW